MAKSHTKPIGQLLIACYFFPLLLVLVFGSASSAASERGKIGFALSTATVSLSALVLYLTLKKWEDEWKIKFRAHQKIEDTPKQIVQPAIPQVNNNEEALKEKEREHAKEKGLLVSECSMLKAEKKELVEAQERLVSSLKEEIQIKDAALIKAQSDLVERVVEGQMKEQIKEQQIAMLATEVENLKFEIKTLLKVGSG